MVVGGQVVIRPMMYLAVSYDHRVVDGQGAVTFLVRVKEHIEAVQFLAFACRSTKWGRHRQLHGELLRQLSVV